MARADTTLETLEGLWPEPDYPSHVVTRCHALRKVPISEMGIEDLRLLIGQRIGLPHLLPRAITVLEADPYAEGDFFPGDLLTAVAALTADDWLGADDLRARVSAIARQVLADEHAPRALSFAGSDFREHLARYL